MIIALKIYGNSRQTTAKNCISKYNLNRTSLKILMSKKESHNGYRSLDSTWDRSFAFFIFFGWSWSGFFFWCVVIRQYKKSNKKVYWSSFHWIHIVVVVLNKHPFGKELAASLIYPKFERIVAFGKNHFSIAAGVADELNSPHGIYAVVNWNKKRTFWATTKSNSFMYLLPFWAAFFKM